MIKVQRSREPAVLARNEKTWTTAIHSAKTPKEREAAIGKYRHDKIKAALVKMFSGKCAYCESKINHIDYGDIEHFKPKSKFPLDAVKWENLLFSCKRCNTLKGDKFPSEGEGEGGKLVNPCDDEPEDHFYFEYDEKAKIAIVRYKTERGKTSEEIYGLNRTDLLEQRSRIVKILIALATNYSTNNKIKNFLDEAAEDKSEYAAFARMIKSTYVK